MSTFASNHWSGPLLWAAFIGWASYDNNGADRTAIIESSSSMVFGVVMAWGVAMIVAKEWLPWSASISGAVAAGVASLLIVLASTWRPLGRVPSTFSGFASTFAFLTLVDGAGTVGRLTELSWNNAAIAVAVSLLIGTGLGVVHGHLAHRLATPEPAPRRAAVRLDGSPVTAPPR